MEFFSHSLCGFVGLVTQLQKGLLPIGVAQKAADHDFEFAEFDDVFHAGAIKCKRFRRNVKRNRVVGYFEGRDGSPSRPDASAPGRPQIGALGDSALPNFSSLLTYGLTPDKIKIVEGATK